MTDALPTLALSVRQPWAWAIIHGGKDVENRTAAAIRKGNMKPGRICIHASKTMTQGEYNTAAMNIWLFTDAIAPPPDELIYGGIIGTVTVTGIVKESESCWFTGPPALVLQDPQPIDPIPSPGALGYFHWRRSGEIMKPKPWMIKQAQDNKHEYFDFLTNDPE